MDEMCESIFRATPRTQPLMYFRWIADLPSKKIGWMAKKFSRETEEITGIVVRPKTVRIMARVCFYRAAGNADAV